MPLGRRFKYKNRWSAGRGQCPIREFVAKGELLAASVTSQRLYFIILFSHHVGLFLFLSYF